MAGVQVGQTCGGRAGPAGGEYEWASAQNTQAAGGGTRAGAREANEWAGMHESQHAGQKL